MTTIRVFKVKPGKIQKLRRWGAVVRTQKKEALKTLKEENALSEELLVFKNSTGWYAVGVIQCAGRRKKTNMARELNQRHRKVMKECLEPVKTSELYKLERGEKQTSS